MVDSNLVMETFLAGPLSPLATLPLSSLARLRLRDTLLRTVGRRPRPWQNRISASARRSAASPSTLSTYRHSALKQIADS